MPYQKYGTQIMPLCPVAIKQNQMEVHAPEHGTWGTVSCEQCEEKFLIGPHRMYLSGSDELEVANQLEAQLKADHANNTPHANSYELPD